MLSLFVNILKIIMLGYLRYGKSGITIKGTIHIFGNPKKVILSCRWSFMTSSKTAMILPKFDSDEKVIFYEYNHCSRLDL